ncbi:cation:proton antiporter [Meridianimarinicoccus sp. RP-17]|uniref:cation:proton antiporter n=1 Tax=Meridianimarinicoccus zhengii TaxID=2056810 RepID=UPI000DAD5A93|nr:monovalent cation/H(+) antiporter subunit G [Phycocomes zhengii]
MIADFLWLGLIAAGLIFFAAGTLGLLRFPDLFCRLHALTKADNLGLALVALGTAGLWATPAAAMKLAVIWALVAVSAATSGHMIARHARRAWRQEDAL